LLEIKFNFYQPNDFSLVFGNRYRLDDSAYEFAELIQDTINRGSNIAVDTPLWKDWSKNHQQTVSDFVAGSLDASLNKIINSSNQQVTIDTTGLKCKRILEGGGYADEQAWFVNNSLVFTDDGWETVRTALGKITLPDLSTTYGLVADAIVTGTLYANLVTILGTTNFYWDSSNIFIIDPDNADNQIRIGKYDDTNYGIGFTVDGGTTWEIEFSTSADISIASSGSLTLQTDNFSVKNADGDAVLNIDGSGNLDVTANGAVDFETNSFSVKNSDGNNMLRITDGGTEEDPSGILYLGEEGYPVKFSGSFILPVANGGTNSNSGAIRRVTSIPSDSLGDDGDVAIVYNTDSGSYSAISPSIGSYETIERFGKTRVWNYERIAGYRAVGNTDASVGGSYWSFSTPVGGLPSFTLEFTSAKYIPTTWYGWNLDLPITVEVYSALGSTTPLASNTFIPTNNASFVSVGLSFSSPLAGSTTYYIAIYDSNSSYNKSRTLIQASTVTIPAQTGISYNGVYVKSNGSYEKSDALALTTAVAHEIDTDNPHVVTTSQLGAVPTSTTVNSKALTGNITLTPSDIGSVPTSTTVNGHALTGNISVTLSDVGGAAASHAHGNITTDGKIGSTTNLFVVTGTAGALTVASGLAARATMRIFYDDTEPASPANGDLWFPAAT
jgi:hypothetical protein